MGRAGGLGCGGLLVVIVLALLLGENPLALLERLEGEAPPPSQTTRPEASAEDPGRAFSELVLASTEDVWATVFRQEGGTYAPPTLVLFDGITPTACGTGQSATGPFYCPGDQNIYLDLGFMNELERMGAPGDFAMAYVVAHEVGHHVQRLAGIEPRVRALQQRAGRTEANQLSVLMELQADCFAGVWAHHADRTQNVLEPGEVREGLAAASAVGDDRLQRMAGRAVQPDAFTHGSSEQRADWFTRGFQQGDADACNTFEAAGVAL